MIGAIGINYETSPLDIREKFSLSETQIIELGNQLKENTDFSGLIVLSTCNRSEFYFQMEDCCEKAAYSFMLKSLKEFCNVTTNVREHFYFKSGDDAFKHLFYVVAGANSMVLGENQIVNQVKQALHISIDNQLADTELTRLFQKSFEANKKIRTKTKINQGAFSVSYAGVEKCMNVFPDITSSRVLVIGTGETGTLTLKNLAKKGCRNIVITNRTFKKAQQVAENFNVEAVPFSSLIAEMQKSDIIIVSTGSKTPLINKSEVEEGAAQRNGKKQLFIDLSVPRNVAYDVAEVKNTIVSDVDQLQEVVTANKVKRQRLITDIDIIVQDYLIDYNNWLSSRNLGDVISTVKSNFKLINQNELAGFKKVNKAEEIDLLDNYGDHIAEKYARLLIKNIKEVTHNGKQLEYVKLMNSLFELS